MPPRRAEPERLLSLVDGVPRGGQEAACRRYRPRRHLGRGEGYLPAFSEDHGRVGVDCSGSPRPESRRVRLHRALLQSKTQALDNRLYESYGVRAAGGISLGGCQPNRVQAIATLLRAAIESTHHLIRKIINGY